ncbi:hypothetical protein COLO4_28437 [Corchorus olitorius]|uniref:Uncharacterized protein n=1 Tax=Corchorus olitorius TaxID=93759 RepID=A0A1R3HKV6_9ROSI|nr:hypothetical protein COLO4_28437 [Corchorus olitorius]
MSKLGGRDVRRGKQVAAFSWGEDDALVEGEVKTVFWFSRFDMGGELMMREDSVNWPVEFWFPMEVVEEEREVETNIEDERVGTFSELSDRADEFKSLEVGPRLSTWAGTKGMFSSGVFNTIPLLLSIESNLIGLVDPSSLETLEKPLGSQTD